MRLFKNTVAWSGFSLTFSLFSLCPLARTTVKDWLKPVQTDHAPPGLTPMLLAILIFSLSLSAQDFEKDFAATGGLTEVTSPTPIPTLKTPPTTSNIVSPELSDEAAPLSEIPGTPIQKLGLIVWGEDDGHLQPALYEFTKLIHSFTDIKIGDLVVLGDPEITINKLEPYLAPKDIDKETIRKLIFTSIFSARAENDEDNSKEIVKDFSKIVDQDQKLKRELSVFNNLSLVKAPPKELNITHSPAWVVTVEKGDILIEGIRSLSRFINSKGELLESELAS